MSANGDEDLTPMKLLRWGVSAAAAGLVFVYIKSNLAEMAEGISVIETALFLIVVFGLILYAGFGPEIDRAMPEILQSGIVVRIAAVAGIILLVLGITAAVRHAPRIIRDPYYIKLAAGAAISMALAALLMKVFTKPALVIGGVIYKNLRKTVYILLAFLIAVFLVMTVVFSVKTENSEYPDESTSGFEGRAYERKIPDVIPQRLDHKLPAIPAPDEPVFSERTYVPMEVPERAAKKNSHKVLNAPELEGWIWGILFESRRDLQSGADNYGGKWFFNKGIYKGYYRNGVLMEERQYMRKITLDMYEKYIPNGVWKYYADNGRLYVTEAYTGGIKRGVMYYSAEGKVLSSEKCD